MKIIFNFGYLHQIGGTRRLSELEHIKVLNLDPGVREEKPRSRNAIRKRRKINQFVRWSFDWMSVWKVERFSVMWPIYFSKLFIPLNDILFWSWIYFYIFVSELKKHLSLPLNPSLPTLNKLNFKWMTLRTLIYTQ